MVTIRFHFAYATLLLALAGCGSEDAGSSAHSVREALEMDGVAGGTAGTAAGTGTAVGGTGAMEQAGSFGVDPGNQGIAGSMGSMDSDAGEPTFGTAGIGAMYDEDGGIYGYAGTGAAGYDYGPDSDGGVDYGGYAGTGGGWAGTGYSDDAGMDEGSYDGGVVIDDGETTGGSAGMGAANGGSAGTGASSGSAGSGGGYDLPTPPGTGHHGHSHHGQSAAVKAFFKHWTALFGGHHQAPNAGACDDDAPVAPKGNHVKHR